MNKTMKDLVIIGAGDFGREMANIVERINDSKRGKEWKLLGFVDDNEEIQQTLVDGYPVIGPIDYLNHVDEEVYTICALGVAKTRKKVLEKIDNPIIKFATLIDPDARVYRDATVGEGSIICGGSILSINTHVANHVIVNLNCTLGHDAVVEKYSVVNPGVNISGKVTVKECSDLGTGAKVIQGLDIGPNVVIGAGAVVVKGVLEEGTYVGVPASRIF